MIVVAPMSFAPTVAQRPIGPCAKTATVVADADTAALRAREARRHDVGAHQHFLIAEAFGDGAQIRHRVRHEYVVGLAAVDGVAEFPAADRLPAMRGADAILRV